jgi:hypothetical protein
MRIINEKMNLIEIQATIKKLQDSIKVLESVNTQVYTSFILFPIYIKI